MISPRAVADLHNACDQSQAPTSLLAASDYKYAEELKRLKQENMQLRRDLADAHNRIRELEMNQQTTSLFMPSSSYCDSDDFSVEISVTSSATTIPTGSLSKNQNETVQESHRQERDDHETTVSGIIKARGAHYHRALRQSRRHRNPFSRAMPRKIPELRRLFSSESEESSSPSTGDSSALSTRTQGSGVSMNNNLGVGSQSSNQVSSFAMNYFRRTESTESESEPSDVLRFEV